MYTRESWKELGKKVGKKGSKQISKTNPRKVARN